MKLLTEYTDFQDLEIIKEESNPSEILQVVEKELKLK